MKMLTEQLLLYVFIINTIALYSNWDWRIRKEYISREKNSQIFTLQTIQGFFAVQLAGLKLVLKAFSNIL